MNSLASINRLEITPVDHRVSIIRLPHMTSI